MKSRLLTPSVILLGILNGNNSFASVNLIKQNDRYQKTGFRYYMIQDNMGMPVEYKGLIPATTENPDFKGFLFGKTLEMNSGHQSNPLPYKNLIRYNQSGVILSDKGLNFKKTHKYLGYSTLFLAGITAISSSNRSIHYGTAYAASGTALFTCLTGYIAYHNYIKLSNGLFSGINSHVSLGVLGTIGFTTAVILADSGNRASHSSFGGTGTASMLLSFVILKL